MKTKNNVQKTISRTLAVVVSFVLISFTVTAQDFWKTVLTNSSFNKIAIAMAETTKKPDSTPDVSGIKPVDYIYENDYEEKLEVEEWMTNNQYFNPVVVNEVENENELQVEDWMLTDKAFNTPETEDQLQVENWMTGSVAWN